MTKEELVKLAVENDLVLEVYDILHPIVMAKMGKLQSDLTKTQSDLKLIKKFASVNDLKTIKTIIADKE